MSEPEEKPTNKIPTPAEEERIAASAVNTPSEIAVKAARCWLIAVVAFLLGAIVGVHL